MHEECCSNAGPLIHLYEIGRSEALKIYKKIYVPNIVFHEATLPGRANREELESLGILFIQKVSSITVANIESKLSMFSLHSGELQALALCKERGCSTFLTDDLDARDAAKTVGLEPHGSVGVLVRAYRDGLLSLEQTKQGILELFDKSSLFITKTIVNQAIEELEKQAIK